MKQKKIKIKKEKIILAIVGILALPCLIILICYSGFKILNPNADILEMINGEMLLVAEVVVAIAIYQGLHKKREKICPDEAEKIE